MIHVRICILFLLSVAFSYVSAQEKDLKELKLELKNAKHDSSVIRIYNELSQHYLGISEDSVFFYNKASIEKSVATKLYNFDGYYQKAYLSLKSNDLKLADENIQYALILAKKNKNVKDIGHSYHLMGMYYDKKHDFKNALENAFKALKVREQFNDTANIISSLNTIGQMYKNNMHNTEGLKYFLKSAQLAEKTGRYSAQFSAYINLGSLYERTRDFQKALEFYKKALTINRIDKDPNGFAICYVKLSAAHAYMDDYDSAYYYSMKTIAIHHQENNIKGLMTSYYKAAGPLIELGRYDEALKYLDSSYHLSKQYNDSLFMSFYFGNVALINYKTGDKKKALEGFLNSEKLFPNKLDYTSRARLYKRISEAYSELGDYKNAYQYKLYQNSATDSASVQNDIKKQTELKLSYEFNQIQEQQKQEAKAKELENHLKLEAEKEQRNYLIGLLGLAIIVIIIAVRSFIAKKKSNFLLEKQNVQLEFQKKLVDVKNKEISDSINYAKHIQTACLPDEEQLNLCFSDYFLLFKPRDVVSGDFFWTAQTQDGKVLLAVADCTGHGVPGAIMSMIGSMLLNEIFYVKNISSPDDVLSELNRLVKLTLKQTNIGSSSRDGMDIAFCLWDNSTKKLSYSGANRPLYLISNDGALNELKPSKLPIGGNTDLHQKYDLQELILNSGDRIVLSSDGYADQFGGEKEKKINTKKFKEILTTNYSKDSDSIKIELNTYFDQWKGTHEQTDDVLVFSFKA